MKCPKCFEGLEVFNFQNLNLDKCFVCHGIWFDKNEFKKAIDEYDKDLAWMHFDLWRDKEKIGAAPSKRLCPRCKKTMAVLNYGGSKVEIDICAGCGGLWLDGGEFAKIIDYLEKSLTEKAVPGYLKEMVKEGGRMILVPGQGAIEVRHFLILTKLLEYRILSEHSFIAGIISTLPK